MAVTKEQVERYAEAVIEYDDARHAVTPTLRGGRTQSP